MSLGPFKEIYQPTASRVSRSDETAGFWLIAKGQPKAGRRTIKRRLRKSPYISAHPFQLATPEKNTKEATPDPYQSIHQTASLKRWLFLFGKNMYSEK
ncbi:hypothetical protein [Planococcus dechangensis]|uniref:Uncharacterized protein n=1 Tax=Planococcus dechangensis TaxID=1176255 RepID=A0ABV9MDF1_9BACL